MYPYNAAIEKGQTVSFGVIASGGDGTSDRFELTMTPDRRELVLIHEVELGYRCVTDPGVRLEIDGNSLAVIQDTHLSQRRRRRYQDGGQV